MTRFPALCVLVFAATALASEFPISTPRAVEAAFSQADASVATNGREYFAVWNGARSSSNPYGYGRSSLYASPVDATGQLVDPFGRKIADNIYKARVASNGHGYLLVYSDYDGNTVTRLVGDDGTIAPPSQYIWPGFIYALGSNGDGFCALLSDAAAEKFAVVFLDPNGVERGPGIDAGDLHQPVLFAAGADYRVVDTAPVCDGIHACTANIRLMFISSSTGEIASRVIAPNVPPSLSVNALAVNQRIFIALSYASTGQNSLVVAIFSTDLDGYDGSPSARRLTSDAMVCQCSSSRPLLAWDGTHLLVGWWDDPAAQPPFFVPTRFVGIRVNPDGTPADTKPLVIVSAVSTEMTAATGTAGVLLIATEFRHPLRSYPPYTYYQFSDVYTMHVRSFDELATGSVAESVVASAPAQFEAAIAASGSRALVTWREFEQPSAIAAAVVGIGNSSGVPSITLAARSDIEKRGVSVAALRDMGIVAWLEEDDQTAHLFAQRIGFDGALRDAQPVEIASQENINQSRGSTSLATDGSQFFLVWNVGDKVLGVRILPDGTVLDHDPILVSRDSGFTFERIDPRVVWTGTSFLVIWSENWYCGCLLISPPPPPQTTVRTASVTAAGALIPTTDSSTLVAKQGPVAETAIARNGDSVMAVWAAGSDDPAKYNESCMHALPLDADGHRLAPEATQFGCVSFFNTVYPAAGAVKIVAKDKGFAAIWSDNTTGDVIGVQLAADATPTSSFVLDTASHPVLSPDAAATPFGTFLIYNRIADEPAYGSVSRLFAQVLDAVKSPKSRSVRR